METLGRPILIAAGLVFVALGVLGIVLPLLPTTVFLLLAAYCFSRSSKTFHDWLLRNRLLGGYIRAYQEGKGMTLREKWITLVTLWVGIGVSAIVFVDVLWVRLVLIAIAVGVTIHLVRLPTRGAVRVETETEEDE